MKVTQDTAYEDLVSDDTVTSIRLTVQWKDVLATTGEIKISKNSFKSF